MRERRQEGPEAGPPGRPGERDELERRLLVEARRYYGQPRGDDAFCRLTERIQHRVHGQIRRSVRNRERALEFLQETFLKAYRSLPRFRMRSAFRTWVGRIARNLCIDESRRQAVGLGQVRSLDRPAGGNPDGTPLVDRLTAAAPGPDARAMQAEARRQVRQAIAALPPIYQEIIQLRTYEGLPYREIAEIAGCSVGAAKQRMYQATKLLREHLKGA